MNGDGAKPANVGILTLVLDKDARALAHAIRNLDPMEVRAMLQKFMQVIDDAILDLERERARKEINGG